MARRDAACLVLMPLTMAVCFTIDALTDSGPDPSLWPVGAVLMLGGVFVGALAATYAGVIGRVLLARR